MPSENIESLDKGNNVTFPHQQIEIEVAPDCLF